VTVPCPGCGDDGGAREEVARGLDYEYGTCANEFAFVRCGRCATVWLSPRPARDDLPAVYPAHYYAFVEAAGRGGAGPLVRAAWALVERRRARPLLDLIGPGPRAVLDIGCGDGRLLRALRSLGGPRLELVGVEPGIPTDALTRAARGGIEIRSEHYEALDLGRDRFDLVVAQQVIEHVWDPGAVLAKVAAELAPGGHAVFDTPDLGGVDRRIFTGRSRAAWGGYHFPRHLTLFTPETLGALAARQGLEVVAVERLLSPVFWIMSLHNCAVMAGLPRRATERLTYRSAPLLALATAVELPNLVLGRTSNMRVTLRRAVRP
jgi:SAM-dependent methyltransferase